MNITLPKKGYILNDVYYSDRNGNIVATRLSTLLEEENPHLSTYYKQRNFNCGKKRGRSLSPEH